MPFNPYLANDRKFDVSYINDVAVNKVQLHIAMLHRVVSRQYVLVNVAAGTILCTKRY